MDRREPQKKELAGGFAKAAAELKASLPEAKASKAQLGSQDKNVAQAQKVISLSKGLAKWAHDEKVSDEAVNDLLEILQDEVPGMPKDVKSLQAYLQADQL